MARLHNSIERVAAERAHGLLAAIVDSSDDAIISKTLDGVITSWNPAAERLFGYSADEAIGRPITLIIPEDRLEEEKEIIRRLHRGERIGHFTTVRRSKQGRLLDVSLTVSPVRDRAGRIVGASKIARDITRQRHDEEALRESEARFRTLADNIAQFTWMADSSGWVFWYNRRWFDYTGTTLEDMQGWGWRQVHHPDHVDRVVAKIKQCFETGEVWEDTFPLRAKDGSYRWFLSRAIPVLDDAGTVLRWFGTNTDITERMQMESALREADERKDVFLAILAHELRNPLAPIRTGLDLLRLKGDDPALAAKVRATMERQVTQLIRLVDDLTDISRISRGKIELQRAVVEFGEIAQNALETVRPLLQRAGLELTVDVPAQPICLYADAVRLAQVFSNLLNNAIKYTPKGGRIRFEVEREQAELVVRVTDTGQGIPPDMVDRVFDLFAQVPGSLERGNSGLGIGLTLVRTLVEMHGGTVSAQSDGPGHGSQFTVRLPLTTADPEETRPAHPESAALIHGAPRILIVDDNRDAALTLSLLLEALGYTVRSAYDGMAGLTAAAAFHPNVVLLDLGLPKLSGYEVAQRLRQESWGQDLRLIAVTGWGQAADRRRTREVGFDYHLVKPITPDILRPLIAQVQRPQA